MDSVEVRFPFADSRFAGVCGKMAEGTRIKESCRPAGVFVETLLCRCCEVADAAPLCLWTMGDGVKSSDCRCSSHTGRKRGVMSHSSVSHPPCELPSSASSSS